MSPHKSKKKRKHRDEANASGHEPKKSRKEARNSATAEEPMNITPRAFKSIERSVAASDPPPRTSTSTEPSTMVSEPPLVATVDVDFRMRYLCGSSPTTRLYRGTVREILALYLPISALEDMSINRLLGDIHVQREEAGYTKQKKRMEKITHVAQNELVAVVAHILGKLCKTPSQLATAVATLKSYGPSIENAPDAVEDNTGDTQEQIVKSPERENRRHRVMSPDTPRSRAPTSPAEAKACLIESNDAISSSPQHVIKPEPGDAAHFWSDNSSADEPEDKDHCAHKVPVPNRPAHSYPVLNLFLANSPWANCDWKQVTGSEWGQIKEKIRDTLEKRILTFRVTSFTNLKGNQTTPQTLMIRIKKLLNERSGHLPGTKKKIERFLTAWATRNLHAFPELKDQATLADCIQTDHFPLCDLFIGPEQNLVWEERENFAWTIISNLRAYQAKNNDAPWVIPPPFDDHLTLIRDWNVRMLGFEKERWNKGVFLKVFETPLRHLILQNRQHFRQLRMTSWAKDWEFVTGERW